MTNEETGEVVCIDEAKIIAYGGYGTVFEVPGRPEYLVKQIPLPRPEPVGNAWRYTAHIGITKARLNKIKRDAEESGSFSLICRSIDEIIDLALSSHWYFEVSSGQFKAVWYLQKRAPGVMLADCLRNLGKEPFETRARIAKDVVHRMRTLRRADLVHLDCVPSNIIIDLDSKKTTLIDLDGCGVAKRTARESSYSDEWEVPPFTLGHIESVRLPPWFPQPRIQAGPRTGNYLFGERWVVIDTVIRILTGGALNILSWLEAEVRQTLGNAYGDIRKAIEEGVASGRNYTCTDWAQLYSEKIAVLHRKYDALPRFSCNGTQPDCLEYFANLAQNAYFDPSVLSPQDGSPSPYKDYLDAIKGVIRWKLP